MSQPQRLPGTGSVAFRPVVIDRASSFGMAGESCSPAIVRIANTFLATVTASIALPQPA
jgi:hypothetical protein